MTIGQLTPRTPGTEFSLMKPSGRSDKVNTLKSENSQILNRALSGEIKMNHEIDGVREFSLNELPELAFGHDLQIIKDWKEKNRIK